MINRLGTGWWALYGGQQRKMCAEMAKLKFEGIFSSLTGFPSGERVPEMSTHTCCLCRGISLGMLGEKWISHTLCQCTHIGVHTSCREAVNTVLETGSAGYQMGSFSRKGVAILNLRCMWSGFFSSACKMLRVCCFVFNWMNHYSTGS